MGLSGWTPLIGVPFYLVDHRLERIEAESVAVSRTTPRRCATCVTSAATRSTTHSGCTTRRMAPTTSDRSTRPYRERYRADPFSRGVRATHPRLVRAETSRRGFSETFAVWLTPGLDWRTEYADGRRCEARIRRPRHARDRLAVAGGAGDRAEDDLPVEAMNYTLAEHYARARTARRSRDDRQFDSDLLRDLRAPTDAPAGEPAKWFVQSTLPRDRITNLVLDGRGARRDANADRPCSRDRAGAGSARRRPGRRRR